MVYVISAVPPLTPLTTPLELTVATEVALLLHVPSGVVLLKVVVEPWHTVTGVGGVMAAGGALTVTTIVDAQVPTV